MKKIEKRKIVILVIFALCVVLFAGAFLMLRNWFHANGMHFIGRYGQVHMSQICEGIDQDGNKIESRNVLVDGTITTDKDGAGKFDGKVNIDGLPELEKYGLFPAGLAAVRECGNGLYCLVSYTFLAASSLTQEKWDEEKEWDELSFADVWCSADLWLKDNQIAMKFYQGRTEDEYYIFYTDKGILDIPEVRAKLFPAEAGSAS